MREQGIPPSMQLNSSKLTLQEACSCRQDVLKRQSRCTKDKRENDVLRRTKASRDCMYPDDRCVWEGTPWRGEDGSSRRWCYGCGHCIYSERNVRSFKLLVFGVLYNGVLTVCSAGYVLHHGLRCLTLFIWTSSWC